MTTLSPVEDEYEYPGWLVFNGLYKTTVLRGNESSPADIVNAFNEYSPGTPNNPQSGFEDIGLSEKLREMVELNETTEEFAEGLYSVRYIDEDWVEQWGYDEDGNETMYFLPNHDDIRIYWDFVNDVMIFKGQKRLLERKESELMGAISNDIHLDPISFDFDFFLWILYKQYEGEPFSADFRVRNVTRGATVTETKDNMGAGRVQDSHDILRSVLLIAPLLAGKKIEQLQGNFLLGNHQVKAHIEFGGKVHVKVSDSPLSTLSDLRRMGISLRFLSQIVDLFDEWTRLDPEERYPPPSFFDDMAENAEEEGWGPRFDPEDVKARYERNRDGTESETSTTVPAEDVS